MNQKNLQFTFLDQDSCRIYLQLDKITPGLSSHIKMFNFWAKDNIENTDLIMESMTYLDRFPQFDKSIMKSAIHLFRYFEKDKKYVYLVYINQLPEDIKIYLDESIDRGIYYPFKSYSLRVPIADKVYQLHSSFKAWYDPKRLLELSIICN